MIPRRLHRAVVLAALASVLAAGCAKKTPAPKPTPSPRPGAFCSPAGAHVDDLTCIPTTDDDQPRWRHLPTPTKGD